MDYSGFAITSNFLKKTGPGNDMVFHKIFQFYGNLYISKHWKLHGKLQVNEKLTPNLRGSKQYVWKIDMENIHIFPYFSRTK